MRFKIITLFELNTIFMNIHRARIKNFFKYSEEEEKKINRKNDKITEPAVHPPRIRSKI